jgi:protein-tyrosine kinase
MMERERMAAMKKMGRRGPAAPSVVAPNPADTRLGELLKGDSTVTEQDMQQIFAAQADLSLVAYGESALSAKVVAAYQPNSKRAENLRTLRSELILRWFGRGNSVVAVVEARAGGGCNVLAANMAVTFAQLGERTLLIDANLRVPTQHALFGLAPTHGLVDFIRGRQGFDKVLSEVPGFSQLSVMCAGDLQPNPQELLGHPSFGYAIDTASARYDVVIVDASPMLECADAQIVAARALGVVLATQRHRTSVADAMHVKSQLERAGAVLLGAVIDG